MPLNNIEEILEDLRNGQMVVIMDDESRENEGDLLMVAECVTPEAINFMAKYARGLICLTLSSERCHYLNLPLMAKSGKAVYSTNFTVSIEAAEGVTTGISAADRATTIKAAINPHAHPSDLVQPGHVFPLMAEDGGVLVRAGHTEAGCDLARLAGFSSAAVIVEILKEDGSMARRPDLEYFAQTHQLKMGTIEDLIRYRTQHEKLVTRVLETSLKSRYGVFQLIAFHDSVHKVTHIALVKGEINPDQATLVRVHVENPIFDVLAASDVQGWPLHDAMRRVADSQQGVLVLLTQPHTGVSLIEQIQSYAEPRAGSVGEMPKISPDPRAYGIGAQILADLGVRKMQLMSAPRPFQGLSGFGLEILDYVSD